jgi:hypothetical protein
MDEVERAGERGAVGAGLAVHEERARRRVEEVEQLGSASRLGASREAMPITRRSSPSAAQLSASSRWKALVCAPRKLRTVRMPRRA